MQLLATLEDGSEEWGCPSCGRRIQMQWSPFDLKVLVKGDETAQHSGGKGGLSLGTELLAQEADNALIETSGRVLN